MFGTVIIDAYKQVEKEKIADALEDLCSPCDNYGWSSAGIYCFWDYYTKEILYIGLAVDLCERFMQHNGIKRVDDNCCKYKQISEYFKGKEKLGYSIFVQSTLSQPITHRNQEQYKGYMGEDFNKEDYAGKEGKDHIKQVEGILLEVYKLNNGDYPIWNRMGGSIAGQKATSPGNYAIVRAFNDFNHNPLVSKYSLRELSDNATYERYENFLHAVRMSMLMSGMSYGEALEFYRNHDILKTYDNMIECGYANKKLVV